MTIDEFLDMLRDRVSEMPDVTWFVDGGGLIRSIPMREQGEIRCCPITFCRDHGPVSVGLWWLVASQMGMDQETALEIINAADGEEGYEDLRARIMQAVGLAS